MLAPLSSLDAYRRDAVTVDGAGVDDATVARWLESASRLEHAALVKGPDRERLLAGLLAQLGVVPFPSTPVSAETLAATISATAEAMEDQAYLHLAYSTLASLLRVIPENEVLVRGRVVAGQARTARQLGDTRAATFFYETVEQLGEEYGYPELKGRAWLGYGMLARLRGAFPEARKQFTRVVELAGAADDSVLWAHHELMIAAAAASDYDTAAMHGWKAFKGASTPKQETDALINLAQLLLEAGHPRTALRGFAAALARNPIPRFLLPTLGGAAYAAASALPTPAARAVVRNFAERVECLVKNLGNGARLAWTTASALVEISEALTLVGEPTASQRFSERAGELARSRGFHALVYRLENPPKVAAPATLAPATTAILAEVDELEGAELVGASR